MNGSARSWRAILVALLIAGLLIVALTPATTTSTAQAQDATEFALSVSTETITQNGTSTVVVSINPGRSAIAAVGATVTFDSTAVAATECVALVGLGACNTDTPGVVNVQTVDASGWSSETDLFELTFTGQGLTTDAKLQVDLSSAFDLSGTQIVGGTIDGGLDLELGVIGGDVDCSGNVNIGDALLIAQYTVGLRTDSSCPMSSPRTQINLSRADVDQDDSVDIGDALLIAQCTVGIIECG